MALLFLTLLPVSAFAQSKNPGLSFTGPSILTGQQGATVFFVGTLTNNSTDTISLDGISFSFNNTANFTGIDDPFYNTVPASLAPGASYNGSIFGVKISASTPLATYSGNTANIANTNTRTNISYINPIGFTDANANFISQPFSITVAITTYYWTGNQSSVWNTNTSGVTNFTSDSSGTTNSGTLPTSSSDVIFAATNANTANKNTTLGQDFTINSLTFLGTGSTATNTYTIGGANTLTLQSGITSQLGAASQTLSTNVALGAIQTWANNSLNALTVSGALSGANALTTTGTGTIVLSGTGNTYSGGTTVTQGTLTGTTAAAFGTGNVTVAPTGVTGTSADNATLTSNGSIASTAVVTVNSETGNSGFGIGTLSFSETTPTIGSLSGNGIVVLNNAGGTTLTTGGGNTSATFSGVISNGAGVGSLIKTGTGIFTLSGLSTYSGATMIGNGVLSVNTLANGGAASSIGQSSNAAGNLVLNGAALSYTGTGASTNRLFTQIDSVALDSSGTGALTFINTGAIVQGGTASARTLTLTGTNIGANGLAASLGDSGTGTNVTSLVKNSTGAWALSGANTYSGGTTLSAGTLDLNSASAIGTGTFTIAGGTIDNTSGAPVTLTTNNTLLWNNDFTFAGSNALNLGNGAVPLNANRLVTVAGTTPLTVGGSISGAFAFNVTGPGTITLSGNNTYTGGTIINPNATQNSTVARADSNTAFGTGGVTIGQAGNGTTARLEIVNGRTLSNAISFPARTTTSVGIESASGSNTLSGTISATIGGNILLIQSDTGSTLTLSGAAVGSGGVAVQSVNGSRTVTLQGAGNGVVSGIIQNGTGTLAIAKAGAGIWTMTGANTYTGGTVVNAGTLSGPTLAYSSGSVTVASGATVDYTQNTASTYAASITGTGSVTVGGNPGGGLTSGGIITYTGVDNATSTTVKTGTLLLNHTGGGAVTGPVGAATGGTIGLGGANQIATSSNVTLTGGKLAANGRSDGSASGGVPTSGMGTLQIGDPATAATASTLDFGDASGTTPVTLAFGDSSGLTWNGTVTLTNYTDGTDQLYIGATNDLTPNQLSSIKFGSLTAAQNANGKITFMAAPEPNSLLSLWVGGSVLAGIIIRKRRKTVDSLAV